METPPSDPANTVILYARVSTKVQGAEGQSLQAQEKALKDYAKFKGYTYYFYKDVISGAVPPSERPNLSKGLAMIAEGKARHIIVTKLDRLSRSMKDFIGLISEFAARKPPVYFHALDVSLDTSTPMGTFVIHIFSAMSEMERSITRERTQTTLDSMRDDNLVIGTVPYGKRGVPLPNGKRELQDDPYELEVIEKVKELRSTPQKNLRGRVGPMTYQAIADRLIAEGYKNREGSVRWFPSGVRHILKTHG
jgi:DNA invertase Pin-like site-specific DNA recombinase